MDFRTDYEKRIGARNQKICALYKKYVENNKGQNVANRRIFIIMGKEFGVDPLTIRRVLLECGVITEQKRKRIV